MIAPVLRDAAGLSGWELKIIGGYSWQGLVEEILLTPRQTLQKRLDEAGPSSLQQCKSHRRKGKCVRWLIVLEIYFVLNVLVLSKGFVVSFYSHYFMRDWNCEVWVCLGSAEVAMVDAVGMQPENWSDCSQKHRSGGAVNWALETAKCKHSHKFC